jgi:hypothetical protein
MNPNTTTEYRDLLLAVLTESATNRAVSLKMLRLKSWPILFREHNRRYVALIVL